MADTEIRLHQARGIHDASGASDRSYLEVPGAEHYFPGRRRDALEPIIDWLKDRY